MHDELRLALCDLKGMLRVNVPLKPLTHLRIGGPASYLVEPFHEADVALTVRICRELGHRLRVLAGGSNIVVADEGVLDVVLHVGSLNRVVRDGNRLTAGAGVSLPTMLRSSRELGLAGLESLTGIPAMVGGAVAMNAGTREGATFDHLVSLTVVDPEGEIRVIGRDDFAPGYRDGGLGEAIAVQATFELEPDDPKAIYRRFESYLKFRNSTQPVTERSVGCVFRNPVVQPVAPVGAQSGDQPKPSAWPAGRLIEAAGCKLSRRGGVFVSPKHANYFVNDGKGTSADFVALMTDVRARVAEKFDVELEPEVKLWM